MCPMRWVLLLFSGIIAGYLAWTSSWFSASGEDVGEAPRGVVCAARVSERGATHKLIPPLLLQAGSERLH